jgi:hypothetical protein
MYRRTRNPSMEGRDVAYYETDPTFVGESMKTRLGFVPLFKQL